MPRVTQTLDNLTDGVSTQPQLQRAPGRAEAQENCLSLQEVGLVRRPPTRFLSHILDSFDGFADAFTHEIRMEDGERYIMLVIDGDLKVFDATTGEEATVTYPDGVDYLDTASRGFRAITIKDQTFVVNCAKTVRLGTAASDAWTNEAILFVRSGDYDTNYSVNLDGTEVVVTTPSTGRSDIATDNIATQLKLDLEAETAIDDAFTITLIGAAENGVVGSVLHITRKDGKDFTIAAADGLADSGLFAIKRTIQRFTDLPLKAVEGFTVEVVGDDSTKFDNYFVRYTEEDGVGVWREVAKPGTVVSLDASTMPHVLEYAPPLYAAEVEDFVEWQPADVVTSASGPLRTIHTLTFDGTKQFPPGCTVTIEFGYNLNDTWSSTYTNATGGFVTANTAITALAAAINPGLNIEATVLSTNVLEVKYVPGGPFVPGFSVTIEMDPDTAFYDGNLSLGVNALVGYEVRNLTDGSEGVITANTASTVTCGAGLSGGAYNEFQPGDIIEIRNTGVYFVFQEAEWSERAAGDSESAPFPSFVGGKVEDVLEGEGRLWLFSGPNVNTSRAGELLNFFRETATQILPTDPINVKSTLAGSPNFHSAVWWNGTPLLFSEEGQFEITGVPAFTPTTIALKKVGSFQSSADVRPAVVGDKVFYAAVRAGKAVVRELVMKGIDADGNKVLDTTDLTTHVPNYIQGTPLELIGDDTRRLLFVRTDGNRAHLYVYSFQEKQASWSKWTYWEDVVGLTVFQGQAMVISRRTEGLLLNTIALDRTTQHLDRMVTNDTPGFGVVQTLVAVTWTVPYDNDSWASPTPIPVTVFRADTGEELEVTWVSANEIRHVTGFTEENFEELEVCIGIPYRSTQTLSTIYTRDQNGVARSRGRLVLQKLTVNYDEDNSLDLSVDVTAGAREPRTYVLNRNALTGEMDVPVKAQNKAVEIELYTEALGPFQITSIAWAGESFPTGRSK